VRKNQNQNRSELTNINVTKSLLNKWLISCNYGWWITHWLTNIFNSLAFIIQQTSAILNGLTWLTSLSLVDSRLKKSDSMQFSLQLSNTQCTLGLTTILTLNLNLKLKAKVFIKIHLISLVKKGYFLNKKNRTLIYYLIQVKFSEVFRHWCLIPRETISWKANQLIQLLINLNTGISLRLTHSKK
jgi:hypothetical protein